MIELFIFTFHVYIHHYVVCPVSSYRCFFTTFFIFPFNFLSLGKIDIRDSCICFTIYHKNSSSWVRIYLNYILVKFHRDFQNIIFLLYLCVRNNFSFEILSLTSIRLKLACSPANVVLLLWIY